MFQRATDICALRYFTLYFVIEQSYQTLLLSYTRIRHLYKRYQSYNFQKCQNVISNAQ